MELADEVKDIVPEINLKPKSKSNKRLVNSRSKKRSIAPYTSSPSGGGKSTKQSPAFSTKKAPGSPKRKLNHY